MLETPTIGALATAPQPAGLAVVRLSGSRTKLVLRAIFRGRQDPVESPRKLCFGEIIDYSTKAVIDKALAVYMPGPHSYTGEDVGEFQFHGSPLLVQKLLRSLFAFGVIPAEPGEFTKRAFINGKVELVQAEAVAELISATSEQALQVAGEHLKGRFSEAVVQLGEPLRESLAELEASIDFPEEDIQPATLTHISASLAAVQRGIEKLLETYSYGQALREGFKVLLIGRPNAGKSTLLNLFLGRERAIVSTISGTTRDLIEEEADIDSYRFVFCDSAGLRESDSEVERIGIELARERLSWADLVLFIVDATDHSNEWQNVLEQIRAQSKKIWMVTNKIDLNPNAIATFFCDSRTCAQNFYISARTRDGIDSLRNALVEELRQSLPSQHEANQVVTNERHRSCLLNSLEALARAIDAQKNGLPVEILAAELRTGLSQLEEIVGRTYTEDILGRIFSKFCIGK